MASAEDIEKMLRSPENAKAVKAYEREMAKQMRTPHTAREVVNGWGCGIADYVELMPTEIFVRQIRPMVAKLAPTFSRTGLESDLDEVDDATLMAIAQYIVIVLQMHGLPHPRKVTR